MCIHIYSFILFLTPALLLSSSVYVLLIMYEHDNNYNNINNCVNNQVNHLSPLLLTLELLPIILESASASGDGRIVFMSSSAHSMVGWEPDKMNPQTEQQYDRMRVYGYSKLFNVHMLLCIVYKYILRTCIHIDCITN